MPGKGCVPTRFPSHSLHLKLSSEAIHSFNLMLSRTHQALLNHPSLYLHPRGSYVDPGWLSLNDEVTPSTRYTSNGEDWWAAQWRAADLRNTPALWLTGDSLKGAVNAPPCIQVHTYIQWVCKHVLISAFHSLTNFLDVIFPRPSSVLSQFVPLYTLILIIIICNYHSVELMFFTQKVRGYLLIVWHSVQSNYCSFVAALIR